jgi:hypothetical protein
MFEWLKQSFDKGMFVYSFSYRNSDYPYGFPKMSFCEDYGFLVQMLADKLTTNSPNFEEMEYVYWNAPRVIRAVLNSNATLETKRKAVSFAYYAFSGNFKQAKKLLPKLSELAVNGRFEVREGFDAMTFEACEYNSINAAILALEKKKIDGIISTANGAVRNGLVLSTFFGVEFWPVLFSMTKQNHKMPKFFEGEGELLRQSFNGKHLISFEEDVWTGKTLYLFSKCLELVLPDSEIEPFSTLYFDSYERKLQKVPGEMGFLTVKDSLDKQLADNLFMIQSELPPGSV